MLCIGEGKVDYRTNARNVGIFWGRGKGMLTSVLKNIEKRGHETVKREQKTLARGERKYLKTGIGERLRKKSFYTR